MFNFIKEIKFKKLKKKFINCVNSYGKTETLKHISEIVDISKFHEHDFQSLPKSKDENYFNTKNNNEVRVINRTKKVLITQRSNSENNLNENVNF